MDKQQGAVATIAKKTRFGSCRLTRNRKVFQCLLSSCPYGQKRWRGHMSRRIGRRDHLDQACEHGRNETVTHHGGVDGRNPGHGDVEGGCRCARASRIDFIDLCERVFAQRSNVLPHSCMCALSHTPTRLFSPLQPTDRGCCQDRTRDRSISNLDGGGGVVA